MDVVGVVFVVLEDVVGAGDEEMVAGDSAPQWTRATTTRCAPNSLFRRHCRRQRSNRNNKSRFPLTDGPKVAHQTAREPARRGKPWKAAGSRSSREPDRSPADIGR